MFGFVIGTLCLVALIKVVKHGHYGHHGWHGGGHRRWMLRRLFYRLDTTPGQEKVIEEAFDELHAKREKLWGELRQTKSDLSGAFRGETFDEAKLRTAFERHDALLEELRTAGVEAAKKVHEALRPEQRREVAELIEYGAHGGGYGRCGRGGYGYGGGCHGRRMHGPATVNL
jgi:Spy/CpxP family protein refolding chaperone